MFRICLWVLRIGLAAVAVLFMAEGKAFAVVPIMGLEKKSEDKWLLQIHQQIDDKKKLYSNNKY